MTSDVVRWGVRDRAFELVTGERELRDHARGVFAPWPAPERAASCNRWSARRDADGYALAAGGTPAVHHASAAAVVRAVEYAAVATLGQAPDAPLVFHGALVTRADAAVLILGAPEAGKSTLALALWQRGWALRSDDAVLVDGESCLAWPGPRRVSVRFGSRALLGEALWRRIEARACVTEKGLLFHPQDVEPPPSLPAAVPLALVVLLGRSAAGSPLTRMVPAHALLALPAYTMQTLALGLGASLQRMRTLAGTVPVCTLGRAPLADLACGIEAALA